MATRGIVLALVGVVLFSAVGAQEAEGTFDLGIVAVTCEREPTAFPYQGGDCVLTVDAAIVVTTVDGVLIDTCTPTADANGVTAGCVVPVPFGSTVIITEDVSTIPAGYAPTYNPQTFEVPDEPPTGVFGGPVFLNLPVGGSDDGEAGTGRTLTI